MRLLPQRRWWSRKLSGAPRVKAVEPEADLGQLHRHRVEVDAVDAALEDVALEQLDVGQLGRVDRHVLVAAARPGCLRASRRRRSHRKGKPSRNWTSRSVTKSTASTRKWPLPIAGSRILTSKRSRRGRPLRAGGSRGSLGFATPSSSRLACTMGGAEALLASPAGGAEGVELLVHHRANGVATMYLTM